MSVLWRILLSSVLLTTYVVCLIKCQRPCEYNVTWQRQKKREREREKKKGLWVSYMHSISVATKLNGREVNWNTFDSKVIRWLMKISMFDWRGKNSVIICKEQCWILLLLPFLLLCLFLKTDVVRLFRGLLLRPKYFPLRLSPVRRPVQSILLALPRRFFFPSNKVKHFGIEQHLLWSKFLIVCHCSLPHFCECAR